MLYQTLTGRLPFEGESARALIEKVLHDPLPPPSRFRADLDAGLEAVILKATAPDPQERYLSAKNLAEALEELVGRQTRTHRRARGIHADGGAPAMRQGIPVPRRSHWLVVIALVVVCLSALTYFGFRAILPNRGHELAVAPPLPVPPLHGWIDVRVWQPGSELRRGLRLNQPGSIAAPRRRSGARRSGVEPPRLSLCRVDRQ